MKKIFLFFVIMIFSLNLCFAYEYSEEDKNMFYDAFIEGYLLEMAKTIENLEIEQNKKDEFMIALKNSLDRQNLMNSSWECIKKYPIHQIVSAAVICTEDWNNIQIQKTQKLFEIFK